MSVLPAPYVCVPQVYLVQKRMLDTYELYSSRWLWAAMWVLGTKSGIKGVHYQTEVLA